MSESLIQELKATVAASTVLVLDTEPMVIMKKTVVDSMIYNIETTVKCAPLINYAAAEKKEDTNYFTSVPFALGVLLQALQSDAGIEVFGEWRVKHATRVKLIEGIREVAECCCKWGS